MPNNFFDHQILVEKDAPDKQVENLEVKVIPENSGTFLNLIGSFDIPSGHVTVELFIKTPEGSTPNEVVALYFGEMIKKISDYKK